MTSKTPAKLSSAGAEPDPSNGQEALSDFDERAPRRLPPVRVIRSPRRKVTASARMNNGTLELRIPASCSEEQERATVGKLLARFEEKWRSSQVSLEPRARQLAARFGLPEPRSIRWSTRQRMRWGSCTSATGDIRISSRLADVPPWVLDHVIVHELAHLVVADHSAEFQRLVNQNPLAERAEGYLLALSDIAGDGSDAERGQGAEDPAPKALHLVKDGSDEANQHTEEVLQ